MKELLAIVFEMLANFGAGWFVLGLVSIVTVWKLPEIITASFTQIRENHRAAAELVHNKKRFDLEMRKKRAKLIVKSNRSK